MGLKMSDGRRAGELDLADLIDSYLWDVCDGEDLKHLGSIRESTLENWRQDVRDLLERIGINEYQDEAGNTRKQSSLAAAALMETDA